MIKRLTIVLCVIAGIVFVPYLSGKYFDFMQFSIGISEDEPESFFWMVGLGNILAVGIVGIVLVIFFLRNREYIIKGD